MVLKIRGRGVGSTGKEKQLWWRRSSQEEEEKGLCLLVHTIPSLWRFGEGGAVKGECLYMDVCVCATGQMIHVCRRGAELYTGAREERKHQFLSPYPW